MWFLYFLIFYIFTVFILSRSIIPHLGFRKDQLPEVILPEIKNKISELKKISGMDKFKFLQLAFSFLGNKYHSERLATVTKFNYLFKNLEEIWNQNGYIPCTQSNHLLRIFWLGVAYLKMQK